MLGYDVDFGHMEAISLMMSSKYSEKVVGYAAVALMVHPAEAPEDLMATVVTAIKTDLDANDDAGQCLALACIANMGGDKLAGPLAGSVQRLLVAQARRLSLLQQRVLLLQQCALLLQQRSLGALELV